VSYFKLKFESSLQDAAGSRIKNCKQGEFSWMVLIGREY
jgi:hypothetical protein